MRPIKPTGFASRPLRSTSGYSETSEAGLINAAKTFFGPGNDPAVGSYRLRGFRSQSRSGFGLIPCPQLDWNQLDLECNFVVVKALKSSIIRVP